MLNKKIFLIFFFAFLIRLIAINQSLWLDEAVTANVVKNFDLGQIISKFSPTDFHPPLYYLMMKLWTNIFGYSEVVLRFPSIMFSLLAGYFVYKIAALLAPRSPKGEVGFFSVMFFLFNPLIVYYSQEARMYMMATFLLTAGLYYFFESQKLEVKSQKYNSKVKSLILMNLFFTLAFLSFYGSVFLIAAVILYFLFKKDYKIFILNTLYFILVTLLISPFLSHQLINSKISLTNVTNWSLVLGKANIKNLLLIPIKFSIGRISFYPKWLYYFISGSWSLVIFFVVFKNSIFKIENSLKIENLKLKILMLYLLIFPLFLGFLVSFFSPMLQYFRFLYLIPIVCLLLGFGVSSQAKFNLGGWILAGGFVIFSLVYLLLPQFHREDWKSLVRSLPKDKPIYMITASSDPVKYYDKEIKIIPLRSDSIGTTEGQGEIIVIPYAVEIYGLDYKDSLIKGGYKLKKETSFREVIYEEWIK